jgi:hypothetical protein
MEDHTRREWELFVTPMMFEGVRNKASFQTRFKTFVMTIVDETTHSLLMEDLSSMVKPKCISVMRHQGKFKL